MNGGALGREGKVVDLNCDLGERPKPTASDGDDALMACISSASIACGAHAGDRGTMEQAVRSAISHGVAIGAHPGYPDRPGFGRRELPLSEGEVEELVRQQVRMLATMVSKLGGQLVHVKPHGALYHVAARDPAMAAAVARGAGSIAPGLILVGPVGSSALAVWTGMGLRIAAEAFADRLYAPDGTLVSRESPAALIADPDRAAAQALGIVMEASVTAENGTRVGIRADTICIHGDNPTAPAIARAVRAQLESAGIELRPFKGRRSI